MDGFWLDICYSTSTWDWCVRLCVQDYLKQPGEDVELKDWDVVVAGEVDSWLESHGLQSGADWVELMEWLTKHLPRHDGPVTHGQNDTSGNVSYWIKKEDYLLQKVTCLRKPASKTLRRQLWWCGSCRLETDRWERWPWALPACGWRSETVWSGSVCRVGDTQRADVTTPFIPCVWQCDQTISFEQRQRMKNLCAKGRWESLEVNVSKRVKQRESQTKGKKTISTFYNLVSNQSN